MLEAYGTRKDYAPGARIVRENDRGTNMYLIRSGKVRITKGHGPDEVTLAVLGPGDFFGEMSVVAGLPRSATAIADEHTVVTEIDRETFEGFVSEPFVLDLMRDMARRIHSLDQSVFESAKTDAARRSAMGHIIEQRHWFV